MLGNGRDRKRHEGAPLLQCVGGGWNDGWIDCGQSRQVHQHETRERSWRLSAIGRCGAAGVGLSLRKGVRRVRPVRVGLVHRAARAVPAALHPRFSCRLPSGADGEVPDAQRQNRRECGDSPDEDHHLRRMLEAADGVKSATQRTPLPWSRSRRPPRVPAVVAGCVISSPLASSTDWAEPFHAKISPLQ